MSNNRTPWNLVAGAIALVLVGASALSALEHMSYGDALYQIVLLVLAHNDHLNVHDTPGRLLVILIVLSSLVLVGYLLRWFAEYMIGVSDSVWKRRLQTKVNKLHSHYIVCGLGRVGSQIMREMVLEGVPCVGVDRDPAKVSEAIASGFVAFQGDSSSEDVLHQAGIERATGLVASLGEDSANLLVTLASRALNPKLYIVARANRAEDEVKLKRAGADRVALPFQIGGYHMASMALRPSVVDYMDVVSSSGATTNLQVEEMVVGEHSRLAGHHLGKALAEGSIGATVIAINGSDGTSRVRPSGNEVIYPGDRLIILGAKPDLTKASDLIR